MPGVWTHPLLTQGLPVGLPLGALTVLDIGDDEHPGHWPTLVAPLVRTTIASGRPLAFVQVGGTDAVYANGRGLAEELHTELFALVQDKDLIVYGPPSQSTLRSEDRRRRAVTPDGRPYYSCHIPTLHIARAALAAHEARFGPALVVLDDVGCARPYSQVAAQPGEEEDGPALLGVPLQPAPTAGWLATDLLEFAESRPAAPTVAVWEDSPPLPGREALRAASQVYISSRWRRRDNTVLLTVETRDDLISTQLTTVRTRTQALEL